MGKYTAAQFIQAIRGSGGIISAVADAVGCDWHTAKRYITDYATVRDAFEAERSKVRDKARSNIVNAIVNGDISESKWFLTMTDPEFMPKRRLEHTGEGGLPLGADLEEWKRKRQERLDRMAEMEDTECGPTND